MKLDLGHEATDPDQLRVLISTPMALGGPGVAGVALQQICGLAARGCSVTVVTTGLAPGVSIPPGVRVIRTFSLRDRRLPHRPFGRQNVLRWHDERLAALVRRHAGHFDIAHLWPGHCTSTLAAAQAVGLPALRESPSAHTAEALAQSCREQEAVGVRVDRNHPLRANPRKVRLEEREFDLAAAVLAPSDYVVRTFLDRGFPAERLARHRYGFDPARFPAPVAAERPDRPFTALYAGRCDPAKGLHYALEAWQRSGLAARGRFRIVGTFVPGYAEALGSLIQHPSVEQRAFTEDVGAEMRDADVFVLASVTEGSALVTYEAQASGAVLLASDASGAYMEHGVGGLIHPARNVDTLAEHLAAVAGDRALLGRLRSRALAQRDRLTWSAATDVLMAAYRLWSRR